MDGIHDQDVAVVHDTAVHVVRDVRGVRGRHESLAAEFLPFLNHPFGARLAILSFCFLALNCHPIQRLLELEGPAALG
jgi:hypothetical protein